MYYGHRNERYSPRSARAIKKALARLLAERDRVDGLIRTLLHESEQTVDPSVSCDAPMETAELVQALLDPRSRGRAI